MASGQFILGLATVVGIALVVMSMRGGQLSPLFFKQSTLCDDGCPDPGYFGANAVGIATDSTAALIKCQIQLATRNQNLRSQCLLMVGSGCFLTVIDHTVPCGPAKPATLTTVYPGGTEKTTAIYISEGFVHLYCDAYPQTNSCPVHDRSPPWVA